MLSGQYLFGAQIILWVWAAFVRTFVYELELCHAIRFLCVGTLISKGAYRPCDHFLPVGKTKLAFQHCPVVFIRLCLHVGSADCFAEAAVLCCFANAFEIVVFVMSVVICLPNWPTRLFSLLCRRHACTWNPVGPQALATLLDVRLGMLLANISVTQCSVPSEHKELNLSALYPLARTSNSLARAASRFRVAHQTTFNINVLHWKQKAINGHSK